jgi:hypothetical protein
LEISLVRFMGGRSYLVILAIFSVARRSSAGANCMTPFSICEMKIIDSNYS